MSALSLFVVNSLQEIQHLLSEGSVLYKITVSKKAVRSAVITYQTAAWINRHLSAAIPTLKA